MQGQCVRAGSEQMRRYRSRLDQPQGYGLTHGAMYWQLNDETPIASWASLEYGTSTVTGRWKVQHYLAQDFFAPVTAVPVVDFAEGTLDVYASNDATAALPTGSQVRVEVWAWEDPISKGPRHVLRAPIQLGPQSSTPKPALNTTFEEISRLAPGCDVSRSLLSPGQSGRAATRDMIQDKCRPPSQGGGGFNSTGSSADPALARSVEGSQVKACFLQISLESGSSQALTPVRS